MEHKKIPTPEGLKQKPIKRKGTLVGTRELSANEENTLNIPAKKEGELRVLIFGGVSEIGKNLYALESDDEILILDCGMMFSGVDTPGIDFIVPNIQYLEDRKHMIKGMVISHAHLDHIGGISILMDRLGNPTIYTRKLSIEIIKGRQGEFEQKEPLKFHEVETTSELQISDNFKLNFFAVTHTIPDAMGTIIQTPLGDVVFTGDLKLSHVDGVVDKEEVEEFKIFDKRKILLTLADSTNADRPGFSKSEKKVVENIGRILKEARGRIILSSFSSQIERNIRIIEHAINNGKKVVIQGRSMITNLGIASALGLLKIPPRAIIPVESMKNFPQEQIVVLATGAQGDEFAALSRISKDEHRYVKVDKHDTIIFSSSVIPGNEEPTQTLKDRLSKLGPKMLTFETSDVHSSGHANADELKWIHSKINAKFFIPIHGYHYMQSAHKKVLLELGMPDENAVIPNNGSIIDISADTKTITHQPYSMPDKLTVVDGNAVGSIQKVVLNDRKILGQEGIFVVIVTIDKDGKKLKKSPDIISRGFVYLKESKTLIFRTRNILKRTVEDNIKKNRGINIDSLKRDMSKDVMSYLYRETRKRPIIVPVVFLV